MYSHTNDFLHFNKLLRAREEPQKKCSMRCDVYKNSNRVAVTGLILKVY